MRVAIDARWAQGSVVGGVGRWLNSVMPRLANAVDVVPLTDSRRDALRLDVQQQALRTPIPLPSIGWLEICVPRFLSTFEGVFHSPFYLLPAQCPVPAVVSMHDVSFLTHPDLFSRSRLKGAIWRRIAARSSRSASFIHTVSSWSRDEIVRAYGVPAERIVVIPNGVEGYFRPLADEQVPQLEERLREMGVTGRYLVAFGGARRRRPGFAVQVLEILRGRGHDVQLVVIGPGVAPSAGVIVTTGVPEPTYRLLLAGADALLYPSLFEGFGLPALEAMASGTPPICSPVAALPEVLGDGALWCEDDSEAFAGAVEAMWDDPLAREALVARGIARAARFSWDDVAGRLADMYLRLEMRA